MPVGSRYRAFEGGLSSGGREREHVSGLWQRGNLNSLCKPDRGVVDPPVGLIRGANCEGRHPHVNFDFRRHLLWLFRLDVLRARSLGSLGSGEGNRLPFAKIVESCPCACGLVEKVFNAIRRGNESKTLVGQPLDGPSRSSHESRPLESALRFAVAALREAYSCHGPSVYGLSVSGRSAVFGLPSSVSGLRSGLEFPNGCGLPTAGAIGRLSSLWTRRCPNRHPMLKLQIED